MAIQHKLPFILAGLSSSGDFYTGIGCTLSGYLLFGQFSPGIPTHMPLFALKTITEYPGSNWTTKMPLPDVCLCGGDQGYVLGLLRDPANTHNNAAFLPEPLLTWLTLDESWLWSPLIGLITTRIKTYDSPLHAWTNAPEAPSNFSRWLSGKWALWSSNCWPMRITAMTSQAARDFCVCVRFWISADLSCRVMCCIVEQNSDSTSH